MAGKIGGRSRSEAARAGWATRKAKAEARSAAAHKGWVTKWEKQFRRGGNLGPKGSKYIERKIGPVIEGEDLDNPFDFEDEYDSPPL